MRPPVVPGGHQSLHIPVVVARVAVPLVRKDLERRHNCLGCTVHRHPAEHHVGKIVCPLELSVRMVGRIERSPAPLNVPTRYAHADTGERVTDQEDVVRRRVPRIVGVLDVVLDVLRRGVGPNVRQRNENRLDSALLLPAYEVTHLGDVVVGTDDEIGSPSHFGRRQLPVVDHHGSVDRLEGLRTVGPHDPLGVGTISRGVPEVDRHVFGRDQLA